MTAHDAPIRFARHLGVTPADDGGIVAFSEDGVTHVPGPDVGAVTDLVDGTRTAAEILALAAPPMDPRRVRAVLDALAEHGLVRARVPGTPVPGDGGAGSAAAYWDAVGHSEPDASHVVGVHAVGGVDPEPVRAALAAAGLAPALGTDAPGLLVVLCRDYLDPDLAEVDARLREEGRPWLLAKPEGVRIWLGPLFAPTAPGCWTCLATRLRLHRAAEHHALARTSATGVPRPQVATGPTRAAAAALLAHQVSRWLAGARSGVDDDISVLDTADLRTTHHRRPVRPQCPHCGDPGLPAEQAWRPVPPVWSGADERTGHETAVRRGWDGVRTTYGHLVDPVTGVVKRLVPVGDGARERFGQHVVRSGPNLGIAVGGLAALDDLRRVHSGGTGSSEEEARGRALCEAIERYSAARHGDEAVVRGSLAGLGPDAVDPDDCLLYDPRQFADRDRWNARCAPRDRVGTPVDPRAERDWTPVWSLGRERSRFVPTSLLRYDGTATSVPHAVSTGVAAGASRLDALLRGLLELVERDATAIWWYNALGAAAFDLDALDDPWLLDVRRRMRRAGRRLEVLDVSTDLGLPCAVAVSDVASRPEDGYVLGLGAHLDTRRAVCDAVREMVQTLVSGGGSGPGVPPPRHVRPDPAAVPPVLVELSAGDPEADLAVVLGRLDAAGIEVLAADLTAPDIGLPVLRALAPGLRPLAPRYAPGRLFDVPVRQGRRDRPTPWSELVAAGPPD